ncbi:DNA polymerase IV [Rhodobacteraceae bacterium THAF1]|uniref:DNA polymerase IV n=1 Tax=Palleronia sp. THAF1 TaxID=2587842 RepID=UPI000F3D36EB|nr:DNA polymerase IV [Palleronia sp. THAF1]QFU09640.1 DNA polymerase IV [Palleronia sp. THAF1]VDC17459.1 DNA polymerase IV [Rhodobacteraceae bacterium THAF1]
MPVLCRDCLTTFADGARCPTCRSPRILRHAELYDLSIAHMDCDAFYASVEKRDDPSLRDKPIIVGGGERGVVTTACYIARIKGVRSAMPMFQALKLCPEATIVRPRFEVYAEVSRAVRQMMDELTPVVEPLSLDEAFMDLTGTAKLHGAPPAAMLAGLVKRMQAELGITGSIGLSHNKFLAKIASDLEKPRGFSVIGKAETVDFLTPQPVSLIWGVGAVTREALERAGIRTFSDLRRWDQRDLTERFGGMGTRLWHLARGEDVRRVTANAPVKGVSNETTFRADTGDAEVLDGYLWRMSEKVSGRLKAKGIAGTIVTLKLKRADHRLLTRRLTLGEPTQIADRIYRTARALMEPALAEGPFRLLGVGVSDLCDGSQADHSGDLLDPQALVRAKAERATDAIKARFGTDAIVKGRALR